MTGMQNSVRCFEKGEPAGSPFFETETSCFLVKPIDRMLYDVI